MIKSLGDKKIDAEIRTNDKSEYDIAKKYFNGEKLSGDNRYEGEILAPEGMTEKEYDQSVLDASDNYPELDDAYNAFQGPNSNTAVDDIIESTGGIIPDISGARQQNHGEKQEPDAITSAAPYVDDKDK